MKRKIFYSIVILQTMVLLFACGSSLKDVKKWEEENDWHSIFSAYAYRHKNEEVRNAAKEVFIRSGVSSVNFLAQKLESPYALDRAAACSLLGILKIKESVDALIALFTSDIDVGVRIEAAKALGEIGDVRALRTLAAYARSADNPNVRRYAAESARKLSIEVSRGQP